MTKTKDCPTNNQIPMTIDLLDEVQSRKESVAWNLLPCPHCGAKAGLFHWQDQFGIICGRWGCKEVIGKTLQDAAYVWNTSRHIGL
jgi:hypothetical protein